MKIQVTRRRVKNVAVAFLILLLTAVIGLLLYGITRRIPSTLYFRARQSQSMDLGVPATGEVRAAFLDGEGASSKAVTVDLSRPVTMHTAQQDRYDMEVRLFGIFPLKKVDIRVIEDQELIPMGNPIGIYLESHGVLVVGIAEFETMDGRKVTPAENLLQAGDYVLAVNGATVPDKEELMRQIEGSEGRPVTLTIERREKRMDVVLQPALNQTGQYKAGIWIRDNLQGVGTLTYLDGEGKFGALGHGIADVDTGTIVEVDGGTLYQTEIVNLRRGENGSPGEMTGRIIYDDGYVLGEIRSNSDRGVFGTCNDAGKELAKGEAIPIGLKQEIQLGPAEIYCTLEEEVECFEVEITRIRLEHDNVNRGIELKVTDPELLRRTGGIVQGMSGSPILQNGKIIGAVTHVLINSPERGYGIFIENMLEEGNS
ncbi:MAG: SpoIVB peptidase [Lachnospiraceae bacterium]|nr:SpoIVB peptidase [Lachnospiraceae bacterium]